MRLAPSCGLGVGTHTLYLVLGVLLRRSVPSSGVSSRNKVNGVGFSVSVMVSLRMREILKRGRSQSSRFIRCMYLGHLPIGFAHSPGKLPRKVDTNGLDVGRMEWSRWTQPADRRFSLRGSVLAISSTVAYTIGLTWGGVTAPWGSAMVLVPLVLGLIGLVVFIAYEATFPKHPLVSASLCTVIQIASHPSRTRCRSP